MKLLIIPLLLTPFSISGAATLAYYQFDDAAAGTNASSLASDFNSPARDGTASAVGTSALLPKFSSVTAGSVITNGIGGTVTNASNTTSLEFFNGPSGVANTGGAVGGLVTIDGSGIFNSSSFTMEGFVKVDTFVNYSAIFSKRRANGGSLAWQLDTDASGRLRGRFDTLDNGVGADNQSLTTTGVISDNEWHHIALTYDSSTSTAKIFMDYLQVGSKTVAGVLDLDGGAVNFGSSTGGSRAFDGLIDEARYTDNVLATNDFLRAVPEPSSAFFAVAAACLGLLRRKRN